jgi:ankyrin repeat protein
MACFVSGDVSALSNSTASMDISEGGSEWLPLHVAVFYGLRVEIVDFLVEQYPAAVTLTNGCGMLPLHLAVSCTTFDPQEKQKVIQLLLQTFPESLHIPSSGREAKTAYEIVQQEDKNSPEKEALLEMLHPKQSLGTNTTIERVVQSLWLDNNQGPSHRRSISLIPRPNPIGSNRQRSHSITSPPRHTRSNSVTSSMTTSPSNNTNNNASGSNVVTKLVVAVACQNWDDAIKRLEKKPCEARVWTLSDNVEVDPPCHSLPLFMALRRKAPWAVIQALLKEYPESTQTREYYGMLPLHVACQSGASLEICQAIYELYPEAAQTMDLSRMLPLHLACSSEACRVDVICFLLDAYPESLEIADGKGMLAIDYVRNGKHPHQRLLEQEFGRGLEYWAAPSDVMLIQHLLHQQWDDALERAKSYPQEAGIWTKHPIHGKRRYALHYACKYKAPAALVEELLQAHVEATTVGIDEYQLLPLHLACAHGAADDVVKLLLEYNREAASIPDSLGLLPLHLAITEGASMQVVEYLLEAYPSARKARDSKGFCPHVYAESSHHPSSSKVMELLNDMTFQEEQDGGDESNKGKRRPSMKHSRNATSALLQTKRQRSDRSLQSAKVAPIAVE